MGRNSDALLPSASLLLLLIACGVRSPLVTATDDAGVGGDAGESGVDDDAEAAAQGGTPATFNVFDHLPQFGIYVYADPQYTPPAGVVMWSYGTAFVTQLGAQQQASIGADLAARITYFAQCDNYDRIGSVFFIVEPTGQMPQPTDPRIELVRFITPFSDYTKGALATHVYPDADLSAYANVLADSTHDVWIGIAGGSNPYSGDPCTDIDAGPELKAVGFEYSLDFVSTMPRMPGASTVTAAVSNVSETSTPVSGTFDVASGPRSGHVTVIVSGHGSAAGGDEYEYTEDAVTVAGTQVGTFSTKIDCSSYAKASPDGNPGIFAGNLIDNPRNWCPGALVPSHTFPVTLATGSSSVVLGITPPEVPSGSSFVTSLTFSAP